MLAMPFTFVTNAFEGSSRMGLPSEPFLEKNYCYFL